MIYRTLLRRNRCRNHMGHVFKHCRRQMASAVDNLVYVYSGEGANPDNVVVLVNALKKHLSKKYTVTCITPEDTKKGDWQKTAAAYVVGGGYDLGFINALGDKGAGRIKSYVRSGGRYLGICAGSYFACDHIVFDKGGPQEVCGQRKLKFFPGVCVGPVYGPFNYSVQIGARATPIQFFSEAFEPIKCKGFYSGGGMFIPYMANGYSIIKTLEKYEFEISDDENEVIKKQIQERHFLGFEKNSKKQVISDIVNTEMVSMGIETNDSDFNQLVKSEFELQDNIQGGNSTEDKGELLEVLSSYTDLPGSPIAAVKCKAGEGTAVLCAIHIEYESKALDQEDKYLQPIIEELSEYDEKQSITFSSLLRHVGLDVK